MLDQTTLYNSAVKFFDRESAADCHFELYKLGIRGRLYRLLYLLNENIRIRVRTPVGVTDSADTGPGQGQGTISAAIISSVNLDSGVKETFHEREDETEDE